LLRSLLYVPGNRADLIAKITRFPADGYILDLEDGVPNDEKEKARLTVRDAAPALIEAGFHIHLRVNAVHTDWHREDVKTALETGITRLHIPKICCHDDLRSVDHQMFELATRWGIELPALELYPTIETSRAVLEAESIAAASSRVVGLVLGGDDLTAEWGVERTTSGTELDWVRQRLVVVANAYGQVPIDTTYPFHKDTAGCASDAHRARALGFKGKQAIHPSQCPIFDDAFTPSTDEIERAGAIIAAAAMARADGRGTASAAGTQIDAAVEKAARRLLAWASSLNG